MICQTICGWQMYAQSAILILSTHNIVTFEIHSTPLWRVENPLVEAVWTHGKRDPIENSHSITIIKSSLECSDKIGSYSGIEVIIQRIPTLFSLLRFSWHKRP